MPDEFGKLTQEEKDKLATRLTELGKLGNPQCPICGGAEWLIGDHLVMPSTMGKGGGVVFGGFGYPHVMLISQGCGYTRFVNAVIAGVLPPKPSEEKKE